MNDQEKTQQIIDYIANAKKKTPIKAYIKGQQLPEVGEAQFYGFGDTLIMIGELEHINSYLEEHQDQITYYYIDYDRRNSAIPLLDTTMLNARIEPGAIIRDGVIIEDEAVIMMGAVINIGVTVKRGSMIDMNAVLGARVQVGQYCHIGAGSVLAGVLEPVSAKPVIIEDHVMIGANAVILEGVHVGENAVVAAGSIVLKDVPANSVVAGNPARVVKMKDEQTTSKTALVEELRTL